MVRFAFHLFWKLNRVFMCGQDAFHLHIILARLAEHTDNFAEGVARSVRPVGQVDDDFHAVLGAVKVTTRDEDIYRHPVHIGADENIAMRDAQQADKFGVAAFEHLHNLSFRLAVVALGKHGHAHMVAM